MRKQGTRVPNTVTKRLTRIRLIASYHSPVFLLDTDDELLKRRIRKHLYDREFVVVERNGSNNNVIVRSGVLSGEEAHSYIVALSKCVEYFLVKGYKRPL